MLYYEDTKLRSRRRSREGHVYIHRAKIPLTRAPVSVAYNGAIISCRGGAPAPSQYRALLKLYKALPKALLKALFEALLKALYGALKLY